MLPPTFSVIVPSYNRAEMLREALASLGAQTLQPAQVLVVDDGSTDHTTDVVAAASPKPSLLSQSNRGPGAARNRGLRDAVGEYVVFLDSDDVLLPWALETYADAICHHGRPAVMVARSLDFSHVSELVGARLEPTRTRFYPDYYAASREPMWHGASVIVVRTDAARAVGGFTSEFVNAEDSDLMMRLGTQPGLVILAQPLTVGYRRHDQSAIADIERTARGVGRMLECESRGDYPGGQARRTERRRILARHTRPCTLACMKAGGMGHAWRMFRRTLWWNLQLGHARYLLGFPAMAVIAILQRRFPQPR